MAAGNSQPRQLLLIAADAADRSAATVTLLETDETGRRRIVLSVPAYIGKNGLCPDGERREGSMTTPAGVYHFTKAFGILPDPGCALPYTRLDGNLYWSGDPDRRYNQMADIRETPGLDTEKCEHLISCGKAYNYCLNISFNEEGTPGRGFAIFLHCVGEKPYTAGCAAVSEDAMRTILRTVKEGCEVVIGTKNESQEIFETFLNAPGI